MNRRKMMRHPVIHGSHQLVMPRSALIAGPTTPLAWQRLMHRIRRADIPGDRIDAWIQEDLARDCIVYRWRVR